MPNREAPLIRSLASSADYDACLALQYETWGAGFREAVPPSIMLVAQKLGGVAAGAFDADGRLLGFVFGITGVRNGEITHWSDMLAVRAEAQNGGIGRRLKEFQRREAGRAGATSVMWTYDPLMARNAHLNFNVYGARALEYVPNMYGENTGSDLHRGVGTDRLVMVWPVSDDDLARERSKAAAERMAASRRIAVPADFTTVLRQDPAAAREWRERTRGEFVAALAEGCRIVGFERSRDGADCHYLLAR